MAKTTLENPLLYKRFVTQIAELNPDVEIDPQDIDETLEYDEAFTALQSKYPGLRIAREKEPAEMRQARNYLDEEFGIDDRNVQNLIIDDPSPYSIEELGNVGYVLQSRSEHAKKIDRSLRAPNTRDVRKWAKNPNRYDIRGHDTRRRAR